MAFIKSNKMKPPNGALYRLLKEHEEHCWSVRCSLTVNTITADQAAQWSNLLKLEDEEFEPLAKGYLSALEPADVLKSKATRKAALLQLVEVPKIFAVVKAKDVLSEDKLLPFKERLIKWAATNARATLKSTDEDLLEKLAEAQLLDPSEAKNPAKKQAEKNNKEDEESQKVFRSVLCCLLTEKASGGER